MKTKKPKRAIDELKNRDIKPPWDVSRFMGGGTIGIAGEQACFSNDGDFGTAEQLRNSLEWYVHQFGGKVTWEEN